MSRHRLMSPAAGPDTHRPELRTDQEITVTVARSFDDLMRVVSMRTSVYIAEQSCPYEEEFDGNDMAATHMLGFVGGVVWMLWRR